MASFLLLPRILELGLLIMSLFIQLRHTASYPHYRNLIPNGYNVTYDEHEWPGVGHVARHGGGQRNQFGMDFQAEGHTWTKRLCMMDSDGDGLSNGEELGDPDCKWISGQPKTPFPFKSHPGLTVSPATPHKTDRPYTQEVNLQGDSEQDWCSERAKVGEAAQEFVNFTIPAIELLGGKDVYTCHKFSLAAVVGELDVVSASLQQSTELHVHHVFLMECSRDSWFIDDMVDYPHKCMEHTASLYGTCRRWYMGNDHPGLVSYEACSPPGTVFGRVHEVQSQNKIILLQVHWTLTREPVKVNTGPVQLVLGLAKHKPSSDVAGHLTASAIYSPSMLSGLNSVKLPPGKPSTTMSYKCSPRCSYVPLGGAFSPKPIKFLGYTFHMHTRGVNMTVTLRRCHTRRSHMPDVAWSVVGFDKAAMHPIWKAQKPVEFYPGDWLEWSCSYDTTNDTKEIVGGYDRYTNEMCVFNVVYAPNNDKFRGCAAVTEALGGQSACSYELTTLVQEGAQDYGKFPLRGLLDPKSVDLPRARPVAWKASILLIFLAAVLLTMWAAHLLLSLGQPSNKGWNSADSQEHASSLSPGLRDSEMGSQHTSSYESNDGDNTFLLHDSCPLATPRGNARLHTASWHLPPFCIKAGQAIPNGWGLLQHQYRFLSDSHKRNVCLYIMHLLLDTAALCVMLIPLAQVWCGCSDISADWGTIQLALTYIVASYFAELCWRTHVDKLLLIHHIVTIAVVVTFGAELIWHVYTVPSTLLVLAVFAMMEQPTYAALLVHRILPASIHAVRSWRVAFYSWAVTKLASMALAIYFYVTDWERMQVWVRVSYAAIWCILGSVQIWAAVIHWNIYRKAVKAYRKAGPACFATEYKAVARKDGGSTGATRSAGAAKHI